MNLSVLSSCCIAIDNYTTHNIFWYRYPLVLLLFPIGLHKLKGLHVFWGFQVLYHKITYRNEVYTSSPAAGASEFVWFLPMYRNRFVDTNLIEYGSPLSRNTSVHLCGEGAWTRNRWKRTGKIYFRQETSQKNVFRAFHRFGTNMQDRFPPPSIRMCYCRSKWYFATYFFLLCKPATLGRTKKGQRVFRAVMKIISFSCTSVRPSFLIASRSEADIIYLYKDLLVNSTS